MSFEYGRQALFALKLIFGASGGLRSYPRFFTGGTALAKQSC
jgi:hypothetical protein